MFPLIWLFCVHSSSHSSLKLPLVMLKVSNKVLKCAHMMFGDSEGMIGRHGLRLRSYERARPAKLRQTRNYYNEMKKMYMRKKLCTAMQAGSSY